jgi:hypothetical protein
MIRLKFGFQSRRTGVEEGNIEMPELNNHDNRRNENDNSNNDPIEQIPGEENDDNVNSESEEMDTDENETNDIVLEVPIHYRNEIVSGNYCKCYLFDIALSKSFSRQKLRFFFIVLC